MKEYSVRYEKEYLNYLKKSDLATIREINKEFNDNTSPEAFTTNFYKEISNSIAPIIREANHNLTVALSEPMDALTS
jgi:tyrosine-protein phosphatase YwqE